MSRTFAKWPSETLIILILAPLMFTLYHSMTGDAAIYFTFFKNFFDLPFSYQPNTVSFGATSPLHVVVFAPIHAIFGVYWLPVAKTINFIFVVTGVMLLNRAIKGNVLTAIVLSCLTLLNKPLLTATFQLYETGLAFFTISLIYFLIKQERPYAAVIAAGFLYLIRPELTLVTLAVDAYILMKSEHRDIVFAAVLISAIPAVSYHLYMFLHTGGFVPSSVYARMITSMEKTGSWLDRFVLSIKSVARPSGVVYLAGFFAVLSVRKLWRYPIELLLITPVVLLYMIYPPGHYTQRYLLPITPILAVVVLFAVNRFNRRWLLIGSIPIMLAAHVAYAQIPPRYDYDTLLLKDLSEKLNVIASDTDRVLIYEIQAQYHLKQFCYSLDGIVGSQLFPALTSCETFAHFIADNIQYVVTMDSYAYRKIYDNTLIESLYIHDLSNDVGDTVVIDGLRFEKILTNPVFSHHFKTVPWSDLNVGDSLRVYADDNPLWAGHYPLWNSVYKVTSI